MMTTTDSGAPQSVLVLNSGSSSLKAGLFVPRPGENFAGEHALLTAQASGIGQGGGELVVRDADGKPLGKQQHALASQQDALEAIYHALGTHAGDNPPAAIGHRVVHGGPHLRHHTRITPAVLSTLQRSIHFAPLHLPASLALMAQAGKLFPAVPQAACFDTAFHQTMPEAARRFAIPTEYAAAGVERYGFHGLSYESVIGQMKAEPRRLPERIVLAHLGSGSSLCAVQRGCSVDTTMGLTPAGGIPMATRTGDLDPGVLFFLGRMGRLSLDDLEALVNHQSGLAAISGGSGDMEKLEAAMADVKSSRGRREAATLAFDIFATAIAKSIAALVISLRGLEVLVFTGGIGEHSAPLRAAVLDRLAPFGFRVDAQANALHRSEISTAASKVVTRILPAEEDLAIAAHTRRLLLPHGRPSS